MYVGTPDGHVLLYVIEKLKAPDVKTTFVSYLALTSYISPLKLLSYVISSFLHANTTILIIISFLIQP